MGDYLNATTFAEFIGHLIQMPKFWSWKEGRNDKKKSAFIMARTACVDLFMVCCLGL